MTLEVNFPISNLNDKVLRWMIGQTELPDRLEQSPLARELNTTLVNEQIRRMKLARGVDAEPVALTLPPMSYQQASEGFFELMEDSGELLGIAEVESQPEFAAVLREAVAFLNSIAEVLESYAKMLRTADEGPAN